MLHTSGYEGACRLFDENYPCIAQHGGYIGGHEALLAHVFVIPHRVFAVMSVTSRACQGYCAATVFVPAEEDFRRGSHPHPAVRGAKQIGESPGVAYHRAYHHDRQATLHIRDARLAAGQHQFVKAASVQGLIETVERVHIIGTRLALASFDGHYSYFHL